MTGPAYPAARLVAEKVQPHFERDLAAARELGQQGLAPLADAEIVEAIINAAFWASLRHEEGYSPRISLAFVPPELAGNALRFERPLPLSPQSLVPVAPAVERPGIHLGVWRNGGSGELSVWGATRITPPFCFVLEVVAPGLLVVKHRRGEESAKFINLAVLEGDEVKVLDQSAGRLPGCPHILGTLLGFDQPGDPGSSVNVMVQLAVSMRAHGRGGALLVVPAGSEVWRESIVYPISYSVAPAYSQLAGLMREETEKREQRPWQDALRRAVDVVAGLTAVDGATVIGADYNLLAFGAKIRRRDGCESVMHVVATEPIEGTGPAILDPSQLGGTRHLSAAQFVNDQHDAVALVASQDGRFTVFAWSPCENMVHAHRVETLLL